MNRDSYLRDTIAHVDLILGLVLQYANNIISETLNNSE